MTATLLRILRYFLVTATVLVTDSFTQEAEEEVILSEFIVTTTRGKGYFADAATSATKTATPIREVPQGLNVLTSDFLADLRFDNLRDALQFSTGITVGVNNRVNQEENFTLRGTRLSGSLVDGLTSPTASPQENAFIDRIEIIRGPAAVLYGSGNFGGRVNRVSKRPSFRKQASFEVNAGNYDTYNAILDTAGAVAGSGQFAYRFVGTWQDREDFIGDTYNRRFFAAPSLLWQPTKLTQVTLNVRVTDAEAAQYTQGDYRLGATMDTIVRISPDRNLTEDKNERFTHLQEVALLIDHRFNEVLSMLQSIGWYQKDENVPFAVVGTAPIAGTTQVTRTFQQRDSREEAWSSRTDLLAHYHAFKAEHRTLVSGEFGLGKTYQTIDDYVSDRVDFYNPAPFNYNPYDPSRFSRRTGDRRNGAEKLGYNVAAQQQTSFFDARLGLTAGVRYDQYYADTRNRLGTTAAAQRQTAEGNNLSQRYGASYRVLPQLNLYVLSTDSFAPNTNSNPDGTTFTPSTAENTEVGFKADFLGKFSVTGAVYKLDTHGLLKPDPTRPNAQMQTGFERSRGWELDFNAELTPNWQAFGSYSYNDTTNDTGLRVELYAKHVAKIFTRYNVSRGRLKGLAFGGGVVGNYDRADNLGGTRMLPDFERVDAFAVYKREKITYRLNVANLFDEYYYLFSGGSLYTVADPVKFSASVRYDF
jgi:iron complex outermembrane receptor protein